MWNESNSDIIVSKILGLNNDELFNPIWKKQTEVMLKTLLDAMIWLRDNTEYNVTAKDVWENIRYETLNSIMIGEKYPQLPVRYKEEIRNYFNGLKNIAKSENISKIHGYLQHELITNFKHFGLSEWY